MPGTHLRPVLPMRISVRPPAALVAAALLAAACTTGRGARGAAAAHPRPDPSVISEAEVTGVQQSNVYELVAVLRPKWLVLRGRDTLGAANQIRAYLGSTRLSGNVDALREISPVGITRIEFVPPSAAAARWGLDHNQGAIVVSTEAR